MARFAYTAPPRDWMNRWGEDYAKALPYFEEAVQRTPRYAEAWFKVGVCNGELGRWHEAVTAVQQAIRLKPDNAEAYFVLGTAYGELGRWHEAVTAYQQAIRFQPDFAEAHCNLGAAYRNLGIFQENIVNRVLEDVVKAAKPVSATVIGDFAARGGLSTLVTASWSRIRGKR